MENNASKGTFKSSSTLNTKNHLKQFKLKNDKGTINQKFYGVKFNDREIGFITKSPDVLLGLGKYYVLLVSYITEGYIYYPDDSLENLLEILNADKTIKIYEFETHKQLIKWLNSHYK